MAHHSTALIGCKPRAAVTGFPTRAVVRRRIRRGLIGWRTERAEPTRSDDGPRPATTQGRRGRLGSAATPIDGAVVARCAFIPRTLGHARPSNALRKQSEAQRSVAAWSSRCSLSSGHQRRACATAAVVERDLRQKRYAVSEGQAFCAQQHGCDVWHGYPIGWVAVPVAIRKQWLEAGCVRRSEIRRNWD